MHLAVLPGRRLGGHRLTAPWRRRLAETVVAAVAAVATLVLVGCGAAGGEIPSPTVTPTSPSSTTTGSTGPTATPGVPADGVTLRALGIRNGPEQFSLPAGVVLTTSADQTQQVTLVISRPPPAEVADYLARALPATGFTIGRSGADAMEFSGHGWQGSFVATGELSAVTLQPG